MSFEKSTTIIKFVLPQLCCWQPDATKILLFISIGVSTAHVSFKNLYLPFSKFFSRLVRTGLSSSFASYGYFPFNFFKLSRFSTVWLLFCNSLIFTGSLTGLVVVVPFNSFSFFKSSFSFFKSSFSFSTSEVFLSSFVFVSPQEVQKKIAIKNNPTLLKLFRCCIMSIVFLCLVFKF